MLEAVRITMNLLTVIPITADDASKAERLLDLIFWIGGKKQSGSCLIQALHDVHAEQLNLVRLAAELNFVTVDVLKASPDEFMLKQAAKFITKAYKLPWLYIKPDCVPLKKDWREQLLAAYNAQPKRYMGPHLKTTGEKMVLSGTAIYPCNAQLDDDLIPLSTKTRLIQHFLYENDRSKLRDDAVLLDCDKTGSLVEELIEAAQNPVLVEKKKPGRPKKVLTV